MPVAVAHGYHHGGLREALLDATEQILLEGGIEGFSLRACARRAGVSHAAPAHHFGGERGLLTAFAAVGFERMTERMATYREQAGDDPAARLIAVGQAYIDFALAHRAHFQLMHRHDRLDELDDSLREASGRAFAMLTDTLAQAMRQAGLPADSGPQRTVLAWAAVHGFATLALEGLLGPLPGPGPGLGGPSQQPLSALGAAMLAVLRPALAGDAPAPKKTPARRQPARR